MSRRLCVIPARMGSSRFPGKPLVPILGFPMIGHVVRRCQIENIFDAVVVATCDEEIMAFCHELNVPAIMTSQNHERATDRVEEAVSILETRDKFAYDVVTMVQGDEPMVTPSMLKLAVSIAVSDVVPVVNLVARIDSHEEYVSPNSVKVVMDLNNHALYFSREPIPSAKKAKSTPAAIKQTGLISFQRKFLSIFSRLTPTRLEEIESVDMMRVLEHGFKIACIESDEKSYPVDVPSDVALVESALKNCLLTEGYLKK